jgi:hypothetical protein
VYDTCVRLSTDAVHARWTRVGKTDVVLSSGADGGDVSAGAVYVTALLGAERWPFELTVITVKVYVVPGHSDGCVNVVRGGSTRKQPSPLVWTQYHELDDMLLAASQASETLVAPVAVMRRFVGPDDDFGGAPPAAVGANRSAGTRSKAASVAFRTNMR